MSALLIGTGTYDHPELSKLLSPEADCVGLTEVLRDPEIGQFEVQQLVDADRAMLERAIEGLFLTARRDDVCLLYFSCHGVRNRSDKRSGAQLWERKTKGRVLTRPFAVGDILFTADRAATLTAWKPPVGRRLRSYDVLLSADRRGAPACTK